MTTRRQALEHLKKSRFRSSFHLNEKDKAYVKEKGMAKIEEHARVFVKERLADANPKNDGKQTPMKGHPVFKAMHACAMCCRGCMHKWYRVPLGVPLTEEDQDRIVKMLMYWIEEEMGDHHESV